jgi:hypothetical protein
MPIGDALHVFHYNVCRRHSSIRVTPVMKDGASRLWSLEDLFE